MCIVRGSAGGTGAPTIDEFNEPCCCAVMYFDVIIFYVKVEMHIRCFR